MKPIWIWTITVLLTLFMVLGTDARADTLCGPLCLQRVAEIRGETADIDEFLAEGAEMTLADLVKFGGTAVKCRLSDLTYPAICHQWKGHFVVAEGPGKFWDEGRIFEGPLDDYSGFAIVYSPVDSSDEGVDLRLGTYRWDVGTMRAGEVRTLDLGMKNLGSGELTVFEGVGSCSCLKLVDGMALFDSSDQIGVQSKRLTIRSNDFVGDVVLQVRGVVLPADLNHYPEVLRFGPGVTERRLWWNGATVTKGVGPDGIVRYDGPRPWKGTLKVETEEFGVHEIEMIVEANVWVSPRSVFFGDRTSVDVVVGGSVAGVECPLPVKVSGNRVTVSLGDRRGLVQENLRIRVGKETLDVPVFGLVK